MEGTPLKRLILAVAVAAALLSPSVADACGYKPQCKPSKPTATPVVVVVKTPTPAATPGPPPSPPQTQVPVQQPPAGPTPTMGPVGAPSASTGGGGSSPRFDEYCHVEYDSNGVPHMEIRKTTDTTPPGPRPIEGVCTQPNQEVAWQATPTSTETSPLNISNQTMDTKPSLSPTLDVETTAPQSSSAPTTESCTSCATTVDKTPSTDSPTECWQTDEQGIVYFEDGTPVPCGFVFDVPPETPEFVVPAQVP